MQDDDKIAEELQETLTQCGMSILDLGITYTADRLYLTQTSAHDVHFKFEFMVTD